MESQQSSPQSVFFVRLILGLGQGLALYLLYSAFDGKVWPATAPQLFAPLTVVALFIPLLVSQALGNVRATTLTIWTLAAAAIVAGLAWYDVWRTWPGEAAPEALSGGTIFVSAVFLFVAHALVSCGDADRRIVAHYPTLFDLAWKLGVQAAIVVCFTLAFWIMLWLGIALFDMIKLHGFGRVIQEAWVAIPLTTIAAAAAIHITDTRASLVRGVRTLALTLLGWLLPVIALIAFAFLISLVFTGLQPLWETRSATFLLMAAAAVLVIHINAAYQDGDPERRPPHILRVAGTLAAVELIFIVWIAAYALWLRVDQYGWTADRITSASAVLVAAMFAAGYLIAAILPGLWLKLIERWNVYGTFVFLIVLFALCSPIADPTRLSVESQVARLQSGAIKPDKFDYAYLRRHGGRFGHDALVALSSSKDMAVSETAQLALKQPHPFAVVRPVRGKELASRIRVHPAGGTLPASFLSQKWSGQDANTCLTAEDLTGLACDALVKDIDGDSNLEVVLLFGPPDPDWKQLEVFRERSGTWHKIGQTSVSLCPGEFDALLKGEVSGVEPVQRDLKLGARVIVVRPTDDRPQTTCRK